MLWRCSTFNSQKRNGGRHCCQPPRAPSEGYAGVRLPGSRCPKAAPTRIRSWLTSSGVALRRSLPPKRSQTDLPIRNPEDCVSFDLSGRPEEPKLSRLSHSTFRGPSWDTPYPVSLCSPSLRRVPGTASHGRKISLPAPLTGWPWFGSINRSRKSCPRFPFHRLPAEIGPLVTCRTVLPFPTVW